MYTRKRKGVITMNRKYYTLNETSAEKKGILSSISNSDSIGLGMLLIAGLAIVGKVVSSGYHLKAAKESISLKPSDSE